ncbi:hypothetical protein ASPFODRAFT_53743 [Aspergillus luchuensis CBS 106.47]|uniref:Uncharacterized protein n=1 Tax=Aspergillus luchuensis (strain CBS 106.47) TaxID=1137211 RepID=A0A1M3T0G1_ASPLC|nr:hypothetical protein ASPFODRAFT_53743 [Aspergillus luchuensis CBS 106.47]
MKVCLPEPFHNFVAILAFMARRRKMALRYMYPEIQLRIEDLTATVPLTEHTFANDCLLAKQENKVYQQEKQTK